MTRQYINSQLIWRLIRPALFLLTITLILGLSSIETVHADTIIVSVGGTSLQAAIDGANPGDIIIVEDGVYQESIVIDKAISLIAQNFDANNPVNNTAIIEGSSSSVPVILIEPDIVGVVTIRGFIIHSGDDNISVASQMVIESNYFHSGNDLIDTESGAGGIIRGNVFIDAADDAIDLDDPDYPILIENNRIYSSHDDGIEIRLQNSSAPATQITVTINNNQLMSNNRTGIQFIDYNGDPQDTNRLFIISNNLFARTNITAIGFMGNETTREDLSGADIIEPVYTYGNTFYDNHYALSGGDNHVVFNNIFVSNETAVWRVAGQAEDDSVVAYNLFYENAQHSLDSTLGTGNLIEDPLFNALPNSGADGEWGTLDDDYSGLSLQASSPAIDAGITQYQTVGGQFVPSNPISNYMGSAPDLGSVEYDNGAPEATSTPPIVPTNAPTSVPTIIPTSIPTTVPTESVDNPTSSIYYVDCIAGDDNYLGTSESQAWRSLAKASNANLNPGDSVLLKRGCTWTDQQLEITESGLSGRPIMVNAYGTGAMPRLVNSTTVSKSVEISGSYIYINEIHAVANPTEFEANCDNNPVGYIVGFSFERGSHDNILLNSVAEGFYAGVSIKPDSFNNRILNNQLMDNRMMSRLDTSSNNDAGAFAILIRGNNNEIAHNTISGSDACSYDYGRDGAVVEIYGGSNNSIHHNFATQSDVFTELGDPASANNTYYYNVFSSTLNESKFLVTRGAETSRGPIINTVAYNNTIYLTGAEAEGFVCHAGCNSNILTMRNNIFQVVNNRVGYADAPFIEDHNLFWGAEPVNIATSSNSIQVDPMFVSPETQDFRLQLDSSAINIGVNLGLSIDIAGNAVFSGSAPEIGAYELVEDAPATNTAIPTDLPTEDIATLIPTNTAVPTLIPTNTAIPTLIPTNTAIPTLIPTNTAIPTLIPTNTAIPTLIPTNTAIPTLIPTNTAIPTLIPTNTAIPTAIPVPELHVSDIDVTTQNKGSSRNWEVSATITIHDSQSRPVSGATVTISWTGAVNQSASAITDANGLVTFAIGNALHANDSVTLTVTNITHSSSLYNASQNRDSNGDTNGTSILITHP